MRTWLSFLLLIAAGGIPLLDRAAAAQELEAEQADEASGKGVREVKPAGFYLRDERGELVYVPDISYEQFEQLLQQQRNLAGAPRPAFTLKSMSITGKVVNNRVEADVQFRLEGLRLESVAEGTWFRVPLRFDTAYLRDEPSFEGPGRHFVTFDEDGDGYVCWLQMSDDAVHSVHMPLLIPINRVGEESRITLQAPSPLASTLSLTVPENPAEGMFRDLTGELERPLAFEPQGTNQGVFTTRGVRGDVSISWHKSRAAEERANVRLDVFGTIVVTADELLQEVRSEGRFVVRGFGGPVETFQVRLPPGMQLRETVESGYEVRPLPLEADSENKGQLVEIRLDRPTAGEAHIRLAAELPSTQDDPAWPLTVSKLVDSSLEFMPAQFVFESAARHRGQIDLIIKGDWSLVWDEDAAVPRAALNGRTTSNGPFARFRYYDQNRPLRVWIRQQPARITVEPTYDVYVDSQLARLFAHLECRTSGSKAGSLKLTLPGWTAEIVTFGDIDTSMPVDMSGNTLVIPIPLEAQASGRFSLQIEARQDLTASVVSSNAPLRIVLPTVAAENPTRSSLIVSPATVTLIPADNILLTPRPQKMQALSPRIVPLAGQPLSATDPATVSPDADTSYETKLFRYRDRGTSEQAVFVGDFKVQPQSISVSIASTVTLDRRSYGVEQRLSYRVLHEPVETLQLAFPSSLINSDLGSVRILLGDEPLTPSFTMNPEGDRVPVRVRLPQPMLGPLTLRVIAPRQPIQELDADTPLQLTVPLVFAVTGGQTNTTVIGNSLTVEYQDPLRVELEGGAWTVTESASSPGKLVMTTASDGSDAVIDVSLGSQSLARSTILDQTWVQTRIAGHQRRDRAVFRLRTSQSQLRIRLPLPVDIATVQAAIDHHRVEAGSVDKAGELLVTVPRDAADVLETHVVELWYELPVDNRSWGNLLLEPASIDALDHVDRCYWQLVLPRNRILLWGDQAQAAGLAWRGWLGWHRAPYYAQQDLERWIGAVNQDPVPPTMNTYLFTSFGAPERLTVALGSRTVVLLAASGLALCIGLALIYFPLLRHPVVLLTLGVVLLAMALIAPEMAILAGQAASLGIVLTLVARLIRVVLQRSSRGPATVQGRAQFLDSNSGVRIGRPDGSSRIGASSAPTAAPASSAESKS